MTKSFLPRFHRLSRQQWLSVFSSFSLILVSFLLPFAQPAHAALITSSSVTTSDSRPSATGVTYAVGFTFPSTTSIQCIQVKFATSSSMSTPATSMTSGTGFSLTGGGLTQGSWSNYGSTNGTGSVF